MADVDENQKATTDPEGGDLIARFAEWDRRIDNHWNKWRREAKTCFDMVAGRQWSDVDAETLKDQERLAPVFNKLAPLIDAVSGAEIMGRQEVRYYPREVGDSATNEILTKGAAWIRDRCDADQEESEAFRDAFTCGLGCTETAMDYDEDPEGQVIIARVDPLEMGVDPGARKANLLDKRYLRRRKTMTKEAYEEAFPDFADMASGGDGSRCGFKQLVVNNPRTRYQDGDEIDVERADEGEIVVDEYQWFEKETTYLLADPETGEQLEASEDDFAALEAEFAAWGGSVDAVKSRRRVYYRAFVCGQTLLGPPEVLEDGEFTYKFITGKRDRNARMWYGLVRPMMDPQRWLNQFLSQLLAIMAAQTKGGVIYEDGALGEGEDERRFDKTWAAFGGRTKVAPGALAEGRLQPKPVTSYPNGVDRLLQISTDALRESTGVNPELLGMVDRDQAGVLEHQRKQAAYGILATYFDSFRRYRRVQGRLLLKFIQYLPPDYLVRIVGDDGTAKYVPLLQAGGANVEKFDVIVDEAPAGPNQKAQTWAMLMQLMPYLKDAELPASFWADVARYSPFPNELASKMAEAITQAGEEPDPVAVADQQAELALKQAKGASEAAKARKTNAEAIEKMAEAALAEAQMGVIFPPDQMMGAGIQ